MAARSPLDDWKHQAAGARPTRPGAPAKSKRRSRLLFALIPLLLAGGTALGLLFYIRSKPEPQFLSLSVVEYDKWPNNAFAEQDGKGLRDEFFPNGKVVSQGQERADMILGELAALGDRAGKNPSQAVVIHVCALAAVDRGEVAILPAKADPGNPGTWLPLGQLLDAVGKIGGHRLLILDLRPVGEPRLGQAGDELAPELHAQLSKAEKADRLPYIVVAQCVPAEYPYVSPELRRGVLAEYLRRGLAGGADQAGNGDGQVSAEELVAFARSGVAHWLARHQAPAVAPARYGRGGDFELLSVPKNRPPDEPIDEAPADPPKIVEQWKTLDGWQSRGVLHQAPRTFRQLSEAVVRADRLWTGGLPADLVEGKLVKEASELETQRQSLALNEYPLASVGRVRRVGIPKDKEAEIKKVWLPLIEPLGRPPAKKPDDAKKDEAPKPVQLPEKLPETTPYDGTVSITLQAIDDLTKDPTIDQLRQYADLLHGLKPPPGPSHQELLVLDFFADSQIRYRDLWPAESPRVALRAAIESWAAATTDGRVFKRIEKPLGEANADFRTALLEFFVPNEDVRARSVQSLRELANRYRRVTEFGRAFEKAAGEWEETVALLPLVAGFVPENATARRDLDDSWAALVTKAAAVRDELDRETDAATLDRLAEDLKAQRKQFRGLLKAVPADATPAEWRARLRLPVWSPDERAQRTAETNKAAAELADRVMRETPPRSADDAGARSGDQRRFAEVATQRVKRANDLLNLAVGEAVAAKSGVEWRRAFADRFVERYRSETTPAGRARFAWLLHPGDLPALPDRPGAPPNDPGAQARRDAERAFARWLASDHLEPLAKSLSDQPADAAKALAQELRKAAQRLNTWEP